MLEQISDFFANGTLRGVLAFMVLTGLFGALLYSIKMRNDPIAIRIVFILGMISSGIVGYYYGAEIGG